MEYQNNYPVVICHGLMGWGEQDLIDKKYPHFGLTHEKDLCKHLREQGIEVHRPSLGPVNSGWDRACVLWAYLFGGRVDYGKVHSEKYGHARFGREYPGVMKDLGQDGPHKKINLFGHSFGGPTVKEICALFVYGSEEERNGTDPDGLVHTVTTLSGVNNGTTLADFLGKPGMTFMTYYMLVLNSVFATTPVMKYYNFMTQQWGVMPEVEEITGWKLQGPLSHHDSIKAYKKNKRLDSVAYEMTVDVVQNDVNPHQLPLPDIYYFAQRADGTVDDGKGGRKPSYPRSSTRRSSRSTASSTTRTGSAATASSTSPASPVPSTPTAKRRTTTPTSSRASGTTCPSSAATTSSGTAGARRKTSISRCTTA